MIPAYSRPFSGVFTLPSISSSANIRISDSGVFSSWLTLEINSDLSADSLCSVEIEHKEGRTNQNQSKHQTNQNGICECLFFGSQRAA